MDGHAGSAARRNRARLGIGGAESPERGTLAFWIPPESGGPGCSIAMSCAAMRYDEDKDIGAGEGRDAVSATRDGLRHHPGAGASIAEGPREWAGGVRRGAPAGRKMNRPPGVDRADTRVSIQLSLDCVWRCQTGQDHRSPNRQRTGVGSAGLRALSERVALLAPKPRRVACRTGWRPGRHLFGFHPHAKTPGRLVEDHEEPETT
jgi:hypothetical protein